MISTLPKITFIAGALAVIYQAVFKNLLFTILGLDKTVHPLESFGVRCERVKEPGLEACEDMWLHEPSGLLYIACSNSLSKTQWNPSYV
jgi:arylesterase / paraoxonase